MNATGMGGVALVSQERENMCDAEIAAVLLNRCTAQPFDNEEPAYLDILREGNLSFKHVVSFVGPRDIPDPEACHAESIIFADGSRALRISPVAGDSGWTRWTALQPLH
ncbi:hypothetical protein [Paraburkholderia graminis]|nr:hypothetical protein [Paraburkholderia graminis]MDR6471392.1 hypothetical protein [Paraburkholderia graminis]